MSKTPEPPQASEDAYGAVDPATVPAPQQRNSRAPAAAFKGKNIYGPRPTGIRAIEILDPISWQDRPIPERQWLVPGLIPMRSVTMLSGDGGLGKSILALQLIAACALGELDAGSFKCGLGLLHGLVAEVPLGRLVLHAFDCRNVERCVLGEFAR